jgi:hypothetical protein
MDASSNSGKETVMTKYVLGLLLALVFSASASAQMYKWVDKDGKVQYGDCPPADCKAVPIQAAPAPSPEETQRARQQTEQLIQDQKARDEVRQAEQLRDQRQAEAAWAETQRKCKVFRGRLFVLKQPGVVTLTDDQGNVMRPTDEQRDKMIQELEAFIQKNCR